MSTTKTIERINNETKTIVVNSKTKYLNNEVYFRSSVDHEIFNPFPYKKLFGIGNTWIGIIENKTSLGRSGICINDNRIEFEYTDNGYRIHIILELKNDTEVSYYERVSIPGESLKLPKVAKETIDNFRAWLNNNTHYGKPKKAVEVKV